MKTDAILTAAEEVFARDGILKARMEAIAERSGMAVGTLYNFFDDRTALVSALTEARSAALADELTSALEAAAEQPFAEQVRIYFDVALAHVERHGRFWVELLRAHGASAKKDHTRPVTRERLFAAAQKVIDAGLSQKALRPEGTGVYATLLVGMVRSVLEHTASGRLCLVHQKTGEPERLSHTSRLLTDFFLHGALR